MGSGHFLDLDLEKNNILDFQPRKQYIQTKMDPKIQNRNVMEICGKKLHSAISSEFYKKLLKK